jgi:hypothetical protein
MQTAIAILFLMSVIGYAGLFYLMLTKRNRKETSFDVGVLKETKQIIDTVNKLSENSNQLGDIFKKYDSSLKLLASNQLIFNSEIKQLKAAVVNLQNIEIESRVEEE